MPGYEYHPTDFSGWIWNRARSVGSRGRVRTHAARTCWWRTLTGQLPAGLQLSPPGQPPALGGRLCQGPPS